MKVLVIGGGGREHAIVHTLKKSPKVDHIWCAPGNGGIAAEAECVAIKGNRHRRHGCFRQGAQAGSRYGSTGRPACTRHGRRTRGRRHPCLRSAQERCHHRGQQVLCEGFNAEIQHPDRGLRCFENSADAIEYIKKNGAPIVVKADGLYTRQGRYRCYDRGRSHRGSQGRDRRRCIRRCRCACRYRGIPDRSGGFRARLRRRQAPQDHAVRTGSQACLRP